MTFSNITTGLIYFFTFFLSSFFMSLHQKYYVETLKQTSSQSSKQLFKQKLNQNVIKNINLWFQQEINQKQKIVSLGYLALSLLIPSVIAGVRFNVGTDFQSYLWMFQLIGNNEFPNSSEPIFTYIVKIPQFLFPPEFLFFIIFLLTILFIYLAFRRFTDINWGIALFIWFTICFAPSLNIMRQMLAVSIVLFSFIKLYDKKWVEYFILMLIAILIHNVSIIGLVATLLNPKNKYLEKLIIPMMIVLFLALPFIYNNLEFLITNIVGGRFEEFSEINYSLRFTPILRILPFLFPILFYKKKIIDNYPHAKLFINLKFFEIFIRILFSSVNFGARVAYYFNIVDVVLLSMMFSIIKKEKERNLVIILMLILYIGTFYFNHFRNLNDEIVPFILRGLL